MILDQTFQALANPTRRQILTRLTDGESTVVEIAHQFEMSLNGVSKHLKILEQAGLIRRDIQGRTHYCSIKPDGLEEASEWITYHRRFWENRIDALEQFLEDNRAHTRAGNRAGNQASKQADGKTDIPTKPDEISGEENDSN